MCEHLSGGSTLTTVSKFWSTAAQFFLHISLNSCMKIWVWLVGSWLIFWRGTHFWLILVPFAGKRDRERLVLCWRLRIGVWRPWSDSWWLGCYGGFVRWDRRGLHLHASKNSPPFIQTSPHQPLTSTFSHSVSPSLQLNLTFSSSQFTNNHPPQIHPFSASFASPRQSSPKVWRPPKPYPCLPLLVGL